MALLDFITPGELNRRGILGMNRRNNHYIARRNPRPLYPVVDDKLKTKHAAQYWGMAVPELIGVIDSQHAASQVEVTLAKLESFVIKPAQGSGGKGILVIVSRDGDGFLKPSGVSVPLDEVKRHASNILSGLHSLGGRLDVAMIETLVEFDDAFANYSYQGVPDVRIIVFRRVPVMAMLRCPTKDSDGKANLHQGAIGVGLNMATGQGLFAVQHNSSITEHPDTGHDFLALRVPYWDEMLELAAGSADMTGMGYLGADIVLDRSRGPLLLELNARPGLSIQIANRDGLLLRLRRVDNEDTEKPLHERVQMAKKMFGLPDTEPNLAADK